MEWRLNGDFFVANPQQKRKNYAEEKESSEPYERVREEMSEQLCEWFERHTQFV